MRSRVIKLKQTSQVKNYGSSYRQGLKVRHVVKRDNGWAVKRSGASKASRVFRDQSRAISSARKQAKSAGSAVVIHGRDGKIRDVIRY